MVVRLVKFLTSIMNWQWRWGTWSESYQVLLQKNVQLVDTREDELVAKSLSRAIKIRLKPTEAARLLIVFHGHFIHRFQ